MVWLPAGLPPGPKRRVPFGRRQYRRGSRRWSSPRWREAAISESHRTFICAGCRTRCQLCSRCDRGQRYCSVRCSSAARRASQRRSARRYRQTARGRRSNARRQRRHRERRRRQGKTVTHHGPPAARVTAQGAARSTNSHPHEHDSPAVASRETPSFTCSFCGAPCRYTRRHFVRRRGARAVRP